MQKIERFVKFTGSSLEMQTLINDWCRDFTAEGYEVSAIDVAPTEYDENWNPVNGSWDIRITGYRG